MPLRSLALTMIIVFLGAVYAQIEPKPLEKESFSWKEGKRQRKAWISKHEVAVFWQRNVNERNLPSQLLSLEGKFTSANTMWSVFELSSDLAADVIQNQKFTFAQDPFVRYIAPVMYTSPKATKSSRLIPTKEIIVRYIDDIDSSQISELESTYNLTRLQKFDFVEEGYLYEAESVEAAEEAAEALEQNIQTIYSYLNMARQFATRDVPADALFSDQWHLENTGQGGGTPGEDVNLGDVLSVWDEYQGDGIVIAVIDDGVEIAHEDFAVVEGRSFDYVDIDFDPTRGSHGTACAGLAAAQANTLGVRGVAPLANLIGYSLGESFEASTSANVADAFGRNLDIVSVSSNSWGPIDDGLRIQPISPLEADALHDSARDGRDGKGVVFVWAGGNGEDNGDDAGNDQYVNSRFTIGVGGTDFNGEDVFYSEQGSNIVVVAPTQGDFSDPGVVTTFPTGTGELGNYTDSFNGTSASTPMVSGCVALLLEANPSLTWRDVQHILIESAEQIDATDEDWETNGAGYNINHKYGFGRIHVEDAIALAETWTNVEDEEEENEPNNIDRSIPDNDSNGVVSTINLNSDLQLEHVIVTFSAPDHTRWTDLEVSLTSPAGTRSILTRSHDVESADSLETTSFDKWEFLSVRHWGERSLGTWTLHVRDLVEGETGTFDSWELTIYGTNRQQVDVDDDDVDSTSSSSKCGGLGIEVFFVFMLVFMRRRHSERK